MVVDKSPLYIGHGTIWDCSPLGLLILVCVCGSCWLSASIHLYVYSDVEKTMTFWIDDLTVDASFGLGNFVYKGRVPVNETLVAYFYPHRRRITHLALRVLVTLWIDGLAVDHTFQPRCILYKDRVPTNWASNSFFMRLMASKQHFQSPKIS